MIRMMTHPPTINRMGSRLRASDPGTRCGPGRQTTTAGQGGCIPRRKTVGGPDHSEDNGESWWKL
jgi:hypothetical protein